jgi:aspartyl protease family protein
MALSSSGRLIAMQALGWLGAAAIGACGFIYNREIREFGYTTLHLPRPEAVAAAVSASGSRNKSSASAVSQSSNSRGSIELKAGRNGHFHAEAEINGRRIDVMVDSGASMVALSYDHAQSIGIYVNDKDFTMRSNTANGVIAIAPVMIDRIAIGNIVVRNVEAAVSARGVDLGQPLLGMSFLSRLAKVEMNSGRMILQE